MSVPASPDQPLRLHPNLARVAASYAEIVEQFARTEIDALEANRRVRELVARDDNGLRWAINPADGSWLYQNAAGAWLPGTPPTSGVATLTPHDITNHEIAGGRTGVANPDELIDFTRAEAPTGPDGLTGATYRQAAKQRARNDRSDRTLPVRAVAAAAIMIVLAVFLYWLVTPSGDDPTSDPQPAVSVTEPAPAPVDVPPVEPAPAPVP